MRAQSTFGALDRGMQEALAQAWASIRAGSLGIGAAAIGATGELLAVGRNRINENDPGEDVLAGSSLAHAEMNVLAKLPYRAHDAVELYTTLQPCVQCLGAIRLSSVSDVSVLAPDPLFRGVERMRELTPFMSLRWPSIVQRPVDQWAAFALLYPTHHMQDHPTLSGEWNHALPTVARVVGDVERQRLFDGVESVVDAAERVWDELSACVGEVRTLADDRAAG